MDVEQTGVHWTQFINTGLKFIVGDKTMHTPNNKVLKYLKLDL